MMTTTIITGLILLSIGLSVKISQLLHLLKLSNRENEDIRKKYFESNERQIQQISDLKEKISEKIDIGPILKDANERMRRIGTQEYKSSDSGTDSISKL